MHISVYGHSFVYSLQAAKHNSSVLNALPLVTLTLVIQIACTVTAVLGTYSFILDFKLTTYN